MKQHINRIAAGWGALATGPAIWGVFSMLEKGEIVDLDSPSPYYIMAVLASALVGTACMLTSCCLREGDRNQQDDRLEALESGLARMQQQVETLKSREMTLTEEEPIGRVGSPSFWE